MSRPRAKADAFIELLQPLQKPLEVYCRRMLRKRSLAEDVVQSAVAAAFSAFDRGVEVRDFKAWIFRFVTLEIFNRNRKHEPVTFGHVPVDLPAEESWELVTQGDIFAAMLEDPDVVFEHFDDVVVSALEGLAPLERAVLLLRAIGGFNYEEIHETPFDPARQCNRIPVASPETAEDCPGGLRGRLRPVSPRPPPSRATTMTCNEVRQHWMLYLDSEGDAELHDRISDHLGMCPACAEWFAQQERFEKRLTDRLAAGEATPELWEHVLSRACIAKGRPARRHRFIFGGMLAAAAVLVAVALSFWATSRPQLPDLTRMAADLHKQLLQEQVRPDFVSTSDQEVDRYLKKRVPFRVHCPPRHGCAVRGEGSGCLPYQGSAASRLHCGTGGWRPCVHSRPRPD